MIPDWYELALLTLAVYRVWRLIALDSLLDRPRAWLLRGDPPAGYASPPPGYREHLAYWLSCPFCCGAWLSGIAWIAWLLTPHWTTVLAVPAALSALVALVGSRLDPA